MKHVNLLTTGLKSEEFFLAYPRCLIKFGMKGLIHKLKQNGLKGNLLDTLTNFLNNRKQRVVLNGQHSKWANIEADILQGSILRPLLFLIYVNDPPDNLVWNPKPFDDDISLLSVINDKHLSANKLNQDLDKRNNWAIQWKTSFNLDLSKQAQEVIFS